MRVMSQFASRGIALAGATAVALALTAVSAQYGTVHAQSTMKAKTVPWHGSPTSPHVTYSGAAIVLQGVATGGGNQYFWDFGDGTAPMAWTNITDAFNLGAAHTYTGADGTPYTATLTIRNSSTPATVSTAQFPIVIKNRTLDVETDMAIDRALWYCDLTMSRSTFGSGAPGYGAPYGFWSSGLAQTAAAVHAFGVNNHIAGKNADVDPYQDDVLRGVNYLDYQLTSVAINAQTAGNPDANGNGIGLRAGGDDTYILGAVMDAYVASTNPDATAVAGGTNVKGRASAISFRTWSISIRGGRPTALRMLAAVGGTRPTTAALTIRPASGRRSVTSRPSARGDSRFRRSSSRKTSISSAPPNQPPTTVPMANSDTPRPTSVPGPIASRRRRPA